MLLNESGAFVVELPSLSLPSRKTNHRTIGAEDGTFNGVYIRPSIENGGNVPATGPLSYSPDIWIANQTPIANYQTALATPQSYASASSNNITGGMPSFVYVRGFNNTKSPQTRTVTLYYTPSSLTCWPSLWENNVLLTDQGINNALILEAPPMSIAVGDGTFVWNYPSPLEGSDQYCLIAQFNDIENSNPFPDIHTLLDMAALVRGNLGWGWLNTTFISGDAAQQAFAEPLDFPSDLSGNSSNQYTITVIPTGFVGWDIQLNCSQTDSDGNQVAIPRSRILYPNMIIGTSNVFAAPYSAELYVTLWSNGNAAAPGSNIQIQLSYSPSGQWATEAFTRGLVDPVLLAAMQRVASNANWISPQAVVGIGGYNLTVRA